MISAHQYVFTFWFQSTRRIEHVERKTLKSHFWLYKRIIWKNSMVSGNRKKMARVHAEAHAEGFFFIRHPSTFSDSSSPARVGFWRKLGEIVCLTNSKGDELLGMDGWGTYCWVGSIFRRLPVEGMLVFFSHYSIYICLYFFPAWVYRVWLPDCWWLKSQGQPPSLGCMKPWNHIKKNMDFNYQPFPQLVSWSWISEPSTVRDSLRLAAFFFFFRRFHLIQVSSPGGARMLWQGQTLDV